MALLTPMLALAACSSGARALSRHPSPAPTPVAPTGAAPRDRASLPTWVAHDGAYEIVARDVRDIAAVQPLIEREFETFRAIHGVAPRRVQFVVHDDGIDETRPILGFREPPHPEVMDRVAISVAGLGARALASVWLTPRLPVEGRP